MRTGEIAFERLGQIENVEDRVKRERQDRALREAMVGVIADARRSSPTDRRGVLPPSAPAAQASAPSVERRLEMPGGAASQRLIEQLCDAMLGPGAPAQPKAPAQPAPAPVAAPASPTAEPTTAAAPAAAQALRRRLT
jgi:hypothetical protein